MKGIKTLVSATAIVACLGAASMASAASIAIDGANPNGPFTTPGGTITVRSPSSFNQPVTCNINFSGNIAGGVASITGATVSGSNALCNLPKITGLPWTLSASSTTAGTVTNVGYTISFFPATNCGPTTINVAWSNVTHSLSLSTPQTLSGGCSVDVLNAKPSPQVSVI
ncbi:alkane oxidation protein activator PraB [Pseudomonas protegens]|uniref:alkane oxidation protein activator PraB n=1 Tax=Pseudomonas protegens TaxID=380021 RepID=UPI00098D4924|nr:alkane oxidation protein activator PraB [Pseudomonas protegens]AQT09816.1 protein activator of alkane oxidation PraB [Pseudomonas protegens]MBP5103972.1 protein activator of alkane oxidation PraB [Pseudomonas protegens]MBP5131328.1 protein activator of alkane oxidation PraB [Pseudomonas protegens]MBP5133545.1 protein activator of alkane oxidation PraB [Pseudomonas protegens]MBP5150076.1 protein activator of alkane oxidation PraB [Pseudomonas protegens]